MAAVRLLAAALVAPPTVPLLRVSPFPRAGLEVAAPLLGIVPLLGVLLVPWADLVLLSLADCCATARTQAASLALPPLTAVAGTLGLLAMPLALLGHGTRVRDLEALVLACLAKSCVTANTLAAGLALLALTALSLVRLGRGNRVRNLLLVAGLLAELV